MKDTGYNNTRASYDAGFTLLEVMISLAIIGLTLATVIHTVNYHSDILYRDTIQTMMMQIAKEKMNDLQSDPVASKGAAGSGFSFSNTVKRDEDTGIIELTTVVSGRGETVSLRMYKVEFAR